ncbi:MAG: hypothetical protein GC160_13720 [Acidobacteria bacterium]|nr:hypothetical protein [Acidobacteriota bacterium]
MPAAVMPAEIENPEITQDLAELDAVLTEFDELVAGLEDEGFCWRPEPGRWSIGECMDHLSVTAALYEPVLEECMREGRAAGRTGIGKPRRGILNRLFLWLMAPPVRGKVKAPGSFLPAAIASKQEVCSRFSDRHGRLRRSMIEADGLDLWRNRLVSPASNLIRLSLGEAFALLLTHMRRHLWQARQVRQAPGFPAS